MKYTAVIEPREKGASVVLLQVDNEPVGCVWFNKPYRGVSCDKLLAPVVILYPKGFILANLG